MISRNVLDFRISQISKAAGTVYFLIDRCCSDVDLLHVRYRYVVLFAINMSLSLANDEKSAGVASGGTIFQYEEYGFETESLEKKWQGTAADQLDMDTLGRVQELRVQIPS